MPDIIRLLSDHLANQIAAGEVIQRPASAIKELLENAIDAGATDIMVRLRDAGKELIQVLDNGKGMSSADARMAFERHATSKISEVEDLFSIRTMGFRGEALASIAAVAQVELRTCPQDASVGTRVIIEGTELNLQEPMATAPGTQIMVKNLFFNVPARRHFLKSNSTEMRHIVDEFSRVAMAFPQISFQLWHNDALQMRLESGNLKTRIVGLLGHSAERNLVPVEEDTELLRIRGFIGKPEAAARSRGSQFFFINNRFIRSPFLNHAVTTAYGPLIAKDSFPFYVLFLETDPARVDVNVHPTKQEVKFEDDRLMYAYLQAAIKHALARYNIAPSLDFSLNPEIQSLPSVQLPETEQEKERTRSGYLYSSFSRPNEAHRIAPGDESERWKEAYTRLMAPPEVGPAPTAQQQREPAQIQMTFSNPDSGSEIHTGGQAVLTVQGSLLVTTVKSGLLLVHLRRARERIWFERLQAQGQQNDQPAQRLLFPQHIDLSPADATLLSEARPDLLRIGFDIAPFGGGSFVIQTVPAGLPSGCEKEIIEEILDNLKQAAHGPNHSWTEELLRGLAKRLSRAATPETQDALCALIDELFACAQPEFTPRGKKVFSILPMNDLQRALG
ncbi:MAG: DNA mismatch repair endonuclease MutL [Bacteroidetes bacterium]|nr:DNA mismatch repair endonuclease MutL [Bacteroidota bacterium]MBS1629046.1 DNA mismatch repair endonuclease MutL [Bacteroidota bacterium]